MVRSGTLVFVVAHPADLAVRAVQVTGEVVDPSP
jgi:hypothetical protein